MSLTTEQIEKLRRLANSTNELAAKSAKDKLKAAGISLTAETSTPKSGDANSEQIEKLKRLANSTNALAAKSAKEKLEKMGISLGEEKKTAAPEKKAEEPAKTEPKKTRDFDKFKNEVGGYMVSKHGLAEGFLDAALENTAVGKVIKEGFDKDWKAIMTAKTAVKAFKKAEAHAKKNGSDSEYDCNDLIAQAQERKRKAQERYEKRKKTAPKTPSGKNKSKVEKTAEGVEKNLNERAKKGKVTTAEIDKLISEYKDAIKKLEALRKKIEAGAKMQLGGTAGDEPDYASELKKIKDHHCPCQDGKFAKGGKVKNSHKMYVYEGEAYTEKEFIEFAENTAFYEHVDTDEYPIRNIDEAVKFMQDVDIIEVGAGGGTSVSKGGHGGSAEPFAKGGEIADKHFVREKYNEFVKQFDEFNYISALSPNNTGCLQFLADLDVRDTYKKAKAFLKKQGWDITEEDVDKKNFIAVWPTKFSEGGEIADKHFAAEKSGHRVSKKYASIEMRGGGVYHRRNANQFGKSKGGKEYYEGRENRTDARRYYAEGGKVSGWKHKMGIPVKANDVASLIKEGASLNKKEVKVVFKPAYNKKEHGNLPEHLVKSLKKRKISKFNIIEESLDIIDIKKRPDDYISISWI